MDFFGYQSDLSWKLPLPSQCYNKKTEKKVTNKNLLKVLNGWMISKKSWINLLFLLRVRLITVYSSELEGNTKAPGVFAAGF